jgi:hypothetical protein
MGSVIAKTKSTTATPPAKTKRGFTPLSGKLSQLFDGAADTLLDSVRRRGSDSDVRSCIDFFFFFEIFLFSFFFFFFFFFFFSFFLFFLNGRCPAYSRLFGPFVWLLGSQVTGAVCCRRPELAEGGFELSRVEGTGFKRLGRGKRGATV